MMWQKAKNYYHLAQAQAAALYFGFPARSITVIGVTGTDGKTTTVNMIHHILKKSGQISSMISSVNAQIGDKSYDTGFHVSTPSPWQVQKYLKMAKDAGSKYFVMEATSHGLHQNRLALIKFEVGVLTNITNEHLDYHKKWHKYALAKLKLLNASKTSVVNEDDHSYGFLKDKIKSKIITYSQKGNANFNLKNTSIKLPNETHFNLSNALAAIAAVSQLGIKKEQAQKALQSFSGVKGRMEKVKNQKGIEIYIDFAHTPNGLQQALKSLRTKLAKNARLIAVFGAAGKRDAFKRPQMGEVADTSADIIILTSEDPRNEDPNEIASQIVSGIKNKKLEKDLFINTDRQSAIELAIRTAKKGDIVGIFGKGHEKSMNIGGRELPWDEFKAVEKALK